MSIPAIKVDSDFAIEIDPARLGGGDGACNGYRVTLYYQNELLALGSASSVQEAVSWCARNARKTAERGVAALVAMGFNVSNVP